MKKLIPALLLPIMASAQETETTKKSNNNTVKTVNVTYRVGKPMNLSAAFTYDKFLGKKRKLGVGTGLRLSLSTGKGILYETAPPKISTGKVGPMVFFSSLIRENIDTIKFDGTNILALNIPIQLSYALNKKVLLQFNIDAFGMSFGKSQPGQYLDNTPISSVTGKPTAMNALLIGNNDYGTLNSELVGFYQLNKKMMVKGGVAYLFTEYTTPTKVQTAPNGLTNDRFRNKSGGLALGVSYRL